MDEKSSAVEPSLKKRKSRFDSVTPILLAPTIGNDTDSLISSHQIADFVHFHSQQCTDGGNVLRTSSDVAVQDVVDDNVQILQSPVVIPPRSIAELATEYIRIQQQSQYLSSPEFPATVFDDQPCKPVPDPPVILKDPLLCGKIERGVLNSLAYIERLDMIAAGLLPRDGLTAGASGNGTGTKRPVFKQMKGKCGVSGGGGVRGPAGIGMRNCVQSFTSEQAAAAMDIVDKHKQQKTANHMESSTLSSSSSSSTVMVNNTSIYITGIPPEFTESDLHAIFGAIGKIKKTKLYRLKPAAPAEVVHTQSHKGDGLVTFTNPHDAKMACLQFNNRDFGEGYALKVVMADWGDKGTTGVGTGKSNIATGFSGTVPDSIVPACKRLLPYPKLLSLAPALYVGALLPVPCEAFKFPIVVLQNIYPLPLAVPFGGVAVVNMAEHKSMLVELQNDLLLECCRFGAIKSVVLFEPDTINTTMLDLTNISSNDHNTNSSGIVSEAIRTSIYNDVFTAGSGTAVITYETLESAVSCFKVMQHRKFDRRVLEALVIDPIQCNTALDAYFSSTGNQSYTHQIAADTFQPAVATVTNGDTTTAVADNSIVDPAGADLDAFLNSLL